MKPKTIDELFLQATVMQRSIAITRMVKPLAIAEFAIDLTDFPVEERIKLTDQIQNSGNTELEIRLHKNKWLAYFEMPPPTTP